MQQKLTNKTVGVFFGGQSPEHDISILTGLISMETLQKMGINVVAVYVSRAGAWSIGDELTERSFLECIHGRDLYAFQGWSLDTRNRNNKLILTRRPHFFTRRELIEIDIVLPAFHGVLGEDGALQGLCEFLNVPYTGCGVSACTIAMDKVLTKEYYVQKDIQTTDFVSFSKADWQQSSSLIRDSITKRLGLPVFVKPPHAGSSIGISRVQQWSQLVEAIDLALEFDTHCLVENGVEHVIDLTCCVRENRTGVPEASLVQASDFGDSDFFDYQEKYLQDGGAQTGNAEEKLRIPAPIPEPVTQTIQKTSVEIFKHINASGIARVDWLYNQKTGELFANEINPLPGTFYHHLWDKTGVSIEKLFESLLLTAYRKQEQNQVKNRYFESSILKHIDGVKLGKR